MAIHVAIDTHHFHNRYLLYRQLIWIHFELAKSGDTLKRARSGRNLAHPSFLFLRVQAMCVANIPSPRAWRMLYRKMLEKASEDYYSRGKTCSSSPRIRFSVARVISSLQVPKSDPSIPAEMISTQQCQYFRNTMVFFPRSSLGINIKSVNKKVYVESTDNGFNSIARRAFYIGDALLTVNDAKCTSVRNASNLLLNSLKTKGIARVLVERPVEPAAVAFVRAVLLVNKANVMDPKMPDDVVIICNNELKRMRQQRTEPKKYILKKSNTEKTQNEKKTSESTGSKKSCRSIRISDTSTEVAIGMELLNPALLEHVPEKAKDPTKTRKSKKK
ncbi:hypothetical protein Y032_0580g256 [Ancylostoma ceylanicum]|nr:hypothetical protein Y032_0580g256 [Ancylostoma ceylanicum]